MKRLLLALFVCAITVGGLQAFMWPDKLKYKMSLSRKCTSDLQTELAKVQEEERIAGSIPQGTRRFSKNAQDGNIRRQKNRISQKRAQ